MDEGRPRIVAVVGPTAAGKTDLAAELARSLNGEVVSADSRQVYRRLDIGTAKPPAELRREIPHHLLDVVEPDETFDVAQYQQLARAAIAQIRGRGREVIVCGGSGLYLQALTEGLCEVPPADAELRAELSRTRDTLGLEVLYRELTEVDPVAAERIAPRDAVRIIRALEVARLTGRPLSEWQREHAFADRPFEVLTFVVSPPVPLLHERIEQRAQAMWEAGLLEETRDVLEAGFDGALASLQAIGYREAQEVLRGQIDREEALAQICRQTARLAKRQRTWFRRSEEARWLDGTESLGGLRSEVRNFLAG